MYVPLHPDPPVLLNDAFDETGTQAVIWSELSTKDRAKAIWFHSRPGFCLLHACARPDEKTVGRNVSREIFRLTHAELVLCNALLFRAMRSPVATRPPPTSGARLRRTLLRGSDLRRLRIAACGRGRLLLFSRGKWRLQYLGALGARQRSEVRARKVPTGNECRSHCIRNTWGKCQGAARVTHFCAN